MIKGFVLGVIATIAVALLAGYIIITQGFFPANADARPSHFERWIATRSLNATIRRSPLPIDPLAPTDANLLAGIKTYGEDCSVCHGAANGRPTPIGFGLYQHAPTFGRHGVEDDPDGETYWKVTHGIRLTGMPSFGKALDDNARWQVALFLKHMDVLPPKAQAAWKKLKVASVTAGSASR